MSAKAVSVALICVSQVAAFAPWFSASAVVPSIVAEHALSPTEGALFTSAVQIGFVAGTFLSALLALPDRIDPRRFFTFSAVVAAAANAVMLLVPPTSPLVIAARFVTGACMAGIYPVGMKMVGTWAKGDLGLLIGVLVGAQSLGSGSPHLLNALGGADWRLAIAGTSVAALASALLINFARLGPRLAESPPFHPTLMLKAFATPSIRLVIYGYLGHMWELYAMWAWLGFFLDASFRLNPGGSDGAPWASLTAFAAIGVGGLLGCYAGGVLADRFGRTGLTMGAMAASGTCALVVGLFFGADPALLAVVCFIWGAAVIADSAQFSAGVSELSEPGLVGTMLTVQTCTGFLLTLATIHLMPVLVHAVGWEFAFAALAIGPFFGVWSMGRLRLHPEAVKLAGGRR